MRTREEREDTIEGDSLVLVRHRFGCGKASHSTDSIFVCIGDVILRVQALDELVTKIGLQLPRWVEVDNSIIEGNER